MHGIYPTKEAEIPVNFRLFLDCGIPVRRDIVQKCFYRVKLLKFLIYFYGKRWYD